MKKGISLVALVVTIIVLIILSATVVLTMMDDSIFDKANTAVEEQNRKEVFSAVQREVLNVQLENVGLQVGEEFAQKLQTKLNDKYKEANITVVYNEATGKINIGYKLDEKEYRLELSSNYQLSIKENKNEEQSGTATLEEERAILQQIIKDNFVVDGEIEIDYEQLKGLLPEGWTLSEKDVFMYLRGVYTQNNAFYINEWGSLLEQKGKDMPLWIIWCNEEDKYGSITYLESVDVLNLDDNTVLNNAYEVLATEEESEVMTLTKIEDACLADVINKEYENDFMLGKDDEQMNILKQIYFNVSNLGFGFGDAENLETVVLGENVKYIRTGALSGCNKLKNITLSTGLISIGKEAFYNSKGLTTVTIPNTVTSIGGSAFHGCSNLTTVTIPSSVTSINGSVFDGCTALTSVKVGSQAVYDLLVNRGISADIITIDPSVG